MDKVQQRNTHHIGFSGPEYQEICDLAKKLGVYPRQAIMLKIRGKV